MTDRAIRALDSTCFAALLALALWAPLPLGSARPWAWGILAIGAGILITLQSARDLVSRKSSAALPILVLLAGALFLSAVGWGVLQCVPWVPASWAHPVWREAAALLPARAIAPRISIDPDASRMAILRLLTYAALFWTAFRNCQDARRARTLVVWLVIVGSCYALWGLTIYFSGNATVLWYSKWAYWKDLTSTFVNRNSFATYVGLTTVAAIGLVLERALQSINLGPSSRITRLVTELFHMRVIWLLAALVVGVTALVLTHSRGGTAATAGGSLALFAAISLAPSFRNQHRTNTRTTLAVALGALALVLFSGSATLTRLLDTSWDLESRGEIFETTLRAISERPLLGTGLGTFRYVFATYRTPEIKFLVDLAHNDYLENVLELGIPAAMMLFSAVFLLFIVCMRGVSRRRRDVVFPCVGAAATVLVALHSLVDFSLQIPAVTTYYMLLLGAAVAQSIPTGER